MPIGPTCGESGQITLAKWGVPNARREDKKQQRLPGPHVGKVATSPYPSWESQRLAPGQKKNRHGNLATRGQSGYITPAVLGVPNAQREENKQKSLPGPHVAKVAKSPLPSRGSPTLSAGTKNQKWLPAYITLTSWGSPMLSAQIKIINGYLAHTLPKWLQYPSRAGGPQRSRRGQK